MKYITNLEHRASSSRSKHEGESSLGLCDRLDRTRDNSQRQLPTDHDYAVPTREYQTDQSSLKSAQAAARSVLGKQRQQPHRIPALTRSLHIRPMHSSRSGLSPPRNISPDKRRSVSGNGTSELPEPCGLIGSNRALIALECQPGTEIAFGQREGRIRFAICTG